MTQGTIPSWAVYLGVIGAGASGVTGVANNASLGKLQDISREEVRVAEVRGRMESEIYRLQLQMENLMPKEGILKLHETQGKLIDELVSTIRTMEERYATKQELDLVLRKLQKTNK